MFEIGLYKFKNLNLLNIFEFLHLKNYNREKETVCKRVILKKMHKTKAVAAIYRQPTIMGGIFSSGDFLVFHRNLRTCRHACMIGFPKCDNFCFFGGQPKILVDLHASNPTRPPAVHPTRRAPCMCIQPDAPR